MRSERLAECIGDNVLIEKAIPSKPLCWRDRRLSILILGHVSSLGNVGIRIDVSSDHELKNF
jgi:hypothetical protein